MGFNLNTPRMEFIASASQTEFVFNFKIFKNTDIVAYLTPSGSVANDTTDILILVTDYSIAINGDDGGTLTLVTGATNGDKVTILRNLPYNREVDYQAGGDLLEAVLDADQNYQTYLAQQLEASKSQFVQLPLSLQGTSANLPSPLPLNVIRWNSQANGLENVTIGANDTFINVLIVDKISDLAAINPSLYDTVNVKGYYSANDGGGGLFNYDAAQSAVNNGGTILNGWVRQYNGGLDARWFGSVSNPVFSPSKQDYYTENNVDTDLTELIPEDLDYQTFPQVAQAPNGNIVVSWHHQQQHTGGGLSNIETKVSSDGGKTWTATNVIYGNLSGGDPLEPYYSSLGVDRDGRFILIFGITDGSANRPWVTYSVDGLIWTDIEPITFASDPNPGGTIVPFGQIKLLPSGKLGMTFYVGDNNYVGLLDPDAVNPHEVALKLVVISASPAYSEAVFLPISENVWYYFLREDGVAGTVPYYTTIDGGTTWVNRGNTGDVTPTDFVNSGGWIPQSASIIERKGESYIMLAMGVRKTVSLPYPTAPSIVFMIAKEKEVFTNSTAWRKLQEMQFTDDGFDRDAYVNFIQAPDGNTFVVTNEETATDESRILIGQFNSHKSLPEESVTQQVLTLEGTGGTANTYTGTPLMYYIKQGKVVYFHGSIILSAINTTGALSIQGFPFTMLNNNQVCSILAYNVGAGIVDVGMRSIAGTGNFQLVERNGISNLDSSEVLANLNLRFSGTVIVEEE